MKKLTLGKGLEERSGICNFCEEKDKDCIKASLPITNNFWALKDNKEIQWLRKSMFSPERLVWTIKPEYEFQKATSFPDICKDCIKQLAKLI